MIAQSEFPHRGRFQAQGGRDDGIEESEPWAQADPLIASDGHRLLNALYEKLIPSDQRLRQNGFDQLRQFINAVLLTRCGHGPIKKSFPRKPNPNNERVDLEISKGLAFVPEPDR